MEGKNIDADKILEHAADGIYFVDTQRRITSWNRAAESITGFSAAEVKGRCCSDCILTHVDDKGVCLCKTACPLSMTLEDGKPRKETLNLHHKDGHRVPVHVAVNPVRDESGNIIGAVETFRECSDVIALRSSVERLKQWGCVDVASGLANRRIAEWHLAQRVQEFQRFGWPFSVLLAEIDFYKELQVRWGREGLERIIRMAAIGVQNSLRSVDMVARWAENCFIAIIANTTSAELTGIAERVRMMVDTSYRSTPDGEMHVTLSIGAVAAGPNDRVDTLLNKAERALFESRSAGRNRATIHGLPSAERP